ncbi:MAG TPA: hypothetical protein P5280_10305 [Cyclobacteriaceae bacterium]|nr:hypothetical protein [Cyclobacteriaceae bacterium]
MSSDRDYQLTEEEQKTLNVLKCQLQNLQNLNDRADDALEIVNSSIGQSEEILKKYGNEVDPAQVQQGLLSVTRNIPKLRSWDEIVVEAENNIDSPALMTDILLPEEIQRIEQRVSLLRGEFDAVYRLDKIDWAIVGVAGILATLVDVFLIQMPKHPGFLGGSASEGGPLANWIKERVNSAFSPEEVRKLEKEYWVPYDPSHSGNLEKQVQGLGPGTHRFHSLGHDPILGFIFGVKDILAGTFTAIA